MMDDSPRVGPGHLIQNMLIALLFVALYLLPSNAAGTYGFDLKEGVGNGLFVALLVFQGRRVAPGAMLGLLAYMWLYLDDLRGFESITYSLIYAVFCVLQALFLQAFVARTIGEPVELANRRTGGLVALGVLLSSLVSALPVAFALKQFPVAQAHPYLVVAFSSALLTVIGNALMLFLFAIAPWRQPMRLLWRGLPLLRLSVPLFALFCLSLLLTAQAWWQVKASMLDEGRLQFEQIVSEAESALLHRLQSYGQVLAGLEGLERAHPESTRLDWRHYVDSLDIAKNLPGINGLGMILPISGDVEAAQRTLRDRLELPELRLHPDTALPEKFMISVIEPLEENYVALGLDIGFEPQRRAAAERARETGLPIMTGRILLVQDKTSSPGFLLLRPFMQRNAAGAEVFGGWVYAPFLGKMLMANLTAASETQLGFAVYDGPINPENAVFDSLPEVEHTEQFYQFSKVTKLDIFGRTWTILWRSRPAFAADFSQLPAYMVLLVGAVFNLLLGSLGLALTRRADRVEKLVVQRTNELAEREEMNRSLVDTALVSILQLSRNGTIEHSNGAFARLSGADVSALAGRNISELIPSLTPKRLSALAEDAESHVQELAATTASGQAIIVEVQAKRWNASDGRPHTTLIVRDVTERRRAEQQLQEAESRWDQALRAGEIGVFDIDLPTGTAVFSQTWQKIMGWQPSDGRRGVLELLAGVHPEDQARIRADITGLMAGELTRIDHVYRFRQSNDAWIWTRAIGVVTEYAEGRPKRCIGIQLDTTPIHEAQEALRRNEARFRVAFFEAPSGMALFDAEGRFLEVNNAMTEFLDYSTEELLAMRYSDVAHPEDLPRDLAAIGRLERGKLQAIRAESRFVDRAGRVRWASVHVTVESGVPGTPDRYIAQFLNISEEKELEQTKRDFVATISHELRTPLTSIHGAIRLIGGLDAGALSEQQRKLLATATSNSERLIRLVNDILDLEKITATELHVELKRFDMRSLMEQAASVNAPYAETHQVRFTLDLPEAPVIALVDEQHVAQIMSNLLSNAAKFSPPDEVVTIRLRETKESVSVQVIDNGSGIPPSFQSRVFERFMQADGTARRRKGGTGLGLHISRLLAEGMGGTLTFDRGRTVGAEFILTLPKRPPQRPA